MSNDLKDSESLAPTFIGRFLAPNSGVHAVLFYGADEGPILEAANELVKGWLCLDLTAGVACGVCRACVAFGRSNHVDFKKIVPKGASALIKISAITARPSEPGDEPEQSLQDFFRTSPLFGPRKVAVIAGADRMNSAASNSLLKMLEEPNSFAKIILTTTALGDILPTVLSRCVNVPVHSGREPEPYSRSRELIEKLAADMVGAKPAQALVFAERLRDASEQLQSEQGLGARNAHSLALMHLSQSFLRLHRARPDWVQQVIEAHRRVLGNANATLVFDTLFASLLVNSR